MTGVGVRGALAVGSAVALLAIAGLAVADIALPVPSSVVMLAHGALRSGSLAAPIWRLDTVSGEREAVFEIPLERWNQSGALTGCAWHDGPLLLLQRPHRARPSRWPVGGGRHRASRAR
ncbi:MAG: hypothetical protein M3O23_08660 [Actinomycetota bacterium]|nr:hypothetical protein [Actinomycetota bacterium]